ncbi:hypothetical protein BASA81_006320 [Batrachochytrium salamandrivorans]|nr:hypothetical protein BASA81_006320 [Batrachochytrium salamandrivorans]
MIFLLLALGLGLAAAETLPWMYAARLAQGEPHSNLGDGLAVSNDGTTVLVTSSFRMGAIAFSKPQGDGPWQSQVLLDGQTVESVSLSEDGQVAVMGTPRLYDNGEWSDVGAAWVFAKQNHTFVLEAKLQASGKALKGMASMEGTSVSLSADGSVVLVGAPQDDPRVSDDYGYPRYGYVGCAHVYSRNPTTRQWAPTQKLVASKAYCLKKIQCQTQGSKVSLSGNGKLALVFAHLPDDLDEVVYAFAREGGVGKWTEQPSKFRGGYWGFAASYNGKRLVISGTGGFDKTAAGKWLSVPGLNESWNSGPVAMNGNLLIVGADVYYGNSRAGFGSVVQGKWMWQGGLPLVEASSVALSGDGTVAVLGESSEGEVWVVSSSNRVLHPPSLGPTSSPSAAPTSSPSLSAPSVSPSLSPSQSPSSSSPSSSPLSLPPPPPLSSEDAPPSPTIPVFTHAPSNKPRDSAASSTHAHFPLLFLLLLAVT